MRVWISAMLLASTALGAPALAQDAPHGHDGNGRDGSGDHRAGGGDRGNRGGQPQNQPQGQPQRQPVAPSQNQSQRVPQAGRPNVAPTRQAPQIGRDDPRFRGGQGVQGNRAPGNDPRQNGHAGGDPVGRPGWDNRPGGNGRPGANDRRDRDRAVFQDGRPGYQNGGRGYDGRDQGNPANRWRGDAGRTGGYDRGRDNNGGNWNRGWRNDNRYDWQGYRNQHREIFRGGSYRAPYGYRYRRYGIGVAIAPVFFAQQYWIGDPGYYRLPPAYGPYRWVRYYNDALLVDIYSGVVVDSIPGFFW